MKFFRRDGKRKEDFKMPDLSLDIPVSPSKPQPCKPSEAGMSKLYNNPGFWQGVLTIRQGDLKAAESGGSHATAWLGEAVKRSQDLLEMARLGEISVTSTLEFERWRSVSTPSLAKGNEQLRF